MKICKRIKLPDRLVFVTFPNKLKVEWGCLVEINDTYIVLRMERLTGDCWIRRMHLDNLEVAFISSLSLLSAQEMSLTG